MAKKNKPTSPQADQVALIEDPFGMPDIRVAEEQASAEYVEIQDDPVETEEKLARIREVMSEEQDRQIEQLTETTDQPAEDPEALLAAQIAEDQALEATEKQAQAEAQATSLADLDVSELQSCIETLLFISDKSLSPSKLHELLDPELPRERFHEALSLLEARYQDTHHGMEIVQVAGGYQFRTKAGRAHLARKLVRVQTQRLSSGAMESLAIVAYRQPVMKDDIDKIRGVDSSYFIRGLLDKKLIKIQGRSELPGRPMLYGTTHEFLELFGLNSLDDMPSLKEIEQMVPASEAGKPTGEEDPRVKKMRELVNQMEADKSGAIQYNPEEDEKILTEIKERLGSISTTTPFLEAERQAVLAAQHAAKDAEQAAAASNQEALPELPLEQVPTAPEPQV